MANLAHKEIVNVIFNLNLMAERNLFYWQLDKQYSDSTTLGPHVLDKFLKLKYLIKDKELDEKHYVGRISQRFVVFLTTATRAEI